MSDDLWNDIGFVVLLVLLFAFLHFAWGGTDDDA